MKFYRYEYALYHGVDPRIELIKYVLIKETPQGYWIGFECKDWYAVSWKKWIPKDSKKRYAYPSKLEALNNLIKRMERGLKLCENRALLYSNIKFQAEVLLYNKQKQEVVE